MPETAETTLVCLEELPFPPGTGVDVPEGWVFGLGQIGGGPVLAWNFRLDSNAVLPRGYLDSIKQRHGQWSSVKSLSVKSAVHCERGDSGDWKFASHVPDAESFLGYLSRVPVLPELTAWRLCLEWIGWIKEMAAVPRVLSNVDPSDFLVHARDGIVHTVAFCPVYCLIREEVPLSDYRIARLWTERFALLHAYLKGGRKGAPLRGTPTDNKAFRALFKRFDIGQDRSLAERLDEVAAIFRSEEENVSKTERGGAGLIDPQCLPQGPLARLLVARAVESDPSRFAAATNPPKAGSGNLGAPVFSAYRIGLTASTSSPARVGYLLPPEGWFDLSLIDPLNRRLSHSFLKAHHHCLRIRSVYCDEHLTLLIGDPGDGIPLPSLMAAREGISSKDLLLVLGKLHRALAQFESAGYDAELISPWQLELHLEVGVIHPGWKSLLAMEVSAWPAWEVIVRVERLAECFLPGETNSAWAAVLDLLRGKYFPAITAWMLDWKRFQWAGRAGALENEPITWDERLRPLFDAARDHLDPAQGTQREKFLALLEEGLMLE